MYKLFQHVYEILSPICCAQFKTNPQLQKIINILVVLAKIKYTEYLVCGLSNVSKILRVLKKFN